MTAVFPLPKIVLLLALALPLASQAAPVLACHVSYGGETRLLTARPASSPYTVAPIAIGSYFLFRMVFENSPRDQAAIKLYTYADQDDGAVPIHQASFPYPPSGRAGRYGFTGLQTVYEPLRDGELQYWCGLQTKAGRP